MTLHGKPAVVALGQGGMYVCVCARCDICCVKNVEPQFPSGLWGNGFAEVTMSNGTGFAGLSQAKWKSGYMFSLSIV